MNKNVIKPINQVIKSDQNCFGQKDSFSKESLESKKTPLTYQIKERMVIFNLNKLGNINKD